MKSLHISKTQTFSFSRKTRFVKSWALGPRETTWRRGRLSGGGALGRAGALHLPTQPHHPDLHPCTHWSGPRVLNSEVTAADWRLTTSHRESVCCCRWVSFALFVIRRAWASPTSAGSKSLRSVAWASVPCDLP